MRFLVDKIPTFLSIAKSTGTTPILNAVVKRTFLQHFCGGENIDEVIPTMERLADKKIGVILDLSMEADLDAPELIGQAAVDEAKYVVKLRKESIDIAAHKPNNFIAAKPTSLMPPGLLHSWTSTLNILRDQVNLSSQNGELSLQQFKSLEKTFPALITLDLDDLFEKNDLDKSGTLNFADLSAIFSFNNFENCKALVNVTAPIRKGDRVLTLEDLETGKLCYEETKDLCAYARIKKVKVIIDAEQTYFQTAIDNICNSLCQLYNAREVDQNGWNGPCIISSYQMYRLDTFDRLKADIKRAELDGYSLAVKLVRGAYMYSEKERALEIGIPSPFHDTIEETHLNYNSAVEYVIKKQTSVPLRGEFVKLALVVASHNHESIQKTTALMEKHGVPKKGGWVNFGQLKGMQDGVTGVLASNGYSTNKVIPYGPVQVVIPYIHRRAMENFAMVSAMKYDKEAISKEIRLRLKLNKMKGY
jgi:proline dehydrogenase